MGGAAHTSANQFAALDSDDDDSPFDRDVGQSYVSAVMAAKTKPTTSLYVPLPPPSTSLCLGLSSHVASTFDALCSSFVIADSGATDHMWNDYSAFTSYHPTMSLTHVTLADNTTAPVAGIGTI